MSYTYKWVVVEVVKEMRKRRMTTNKVVVVIVVLGLVYILRSGSKK